MVTPSYNQAEFLPECLQSVLSQNYPNLEYIVMDGGSTDDSAKIIRKHSKFLKAHRIQKDEGQYDAINSGFGLSHGGPNEIMGWLNSDDKHTPWTLRMVNEIFRQYPYVEWISSLYPLIWGSSGLLSESRIGLLFQRRSFIWGLTLEKITSSRKALSGGGACGLAPAAFWTHGGSWRQTLNYGPDFFWERTVMG